MVDSRAFIMAIVDEIRSALPGSNQVDIVAHADSAELTSMRAIALGALLLELINNALKYAFSEGMQGMLTVGFSVSGSKYIAEFEDDGVGIAHGHAPEGFGTKNVEDLARLLGGSIPVNRHASQRPGRAPNGGW